MKFPRWVPLVTSLSALTAILSPALAVECATGDRACIDRRLKEESRTHYRTAISNSEKADSAAAVLLRLDSEAEARERQFRASKAHADSLRARMTDPKADALSRASSGAQLLWARNRQAGDSLEAERARARASSQARDVIGGDLKATAGAELTLAEYASLVDMDYALRLNGLHRRIAPPDSELDLMSRHLGAINRRSSQPHRGLTLGPSGQVKVDPGTESRPRIGSAGSGR